MASWPRPRPDLPAAAALPFACAAVGAGLVTALGFPYFARFVPQAEAGSYSGLYFSVRAIAATVAVPLAGVLIELTGSYRALMAQGAFALLALVPLALARAAGRRPAVARRPLPERIAAIVPCHSADGAEAVVHRVLPHVQQVVLVDDGAPEADAAVLRAIGEWPRVCLVRLAANAGKGDAVAAGAAALMSQAESPDALIVVDADGQHPPDRIPEFVAASADHDIVIGDRRGDRAAMPWTRRCTNAISSALLTLMTGRRMLDSQCGMRLYRTEALEHAPLPPGRYEAETRHLRAALRAGLTVGWVPIPAIYDGEKSSFRPVRDTWRVLLSILGPTRRSHRVLSPRAEFAQRWAVRFALLVAGTLALGAAMPLLQPLDERLFLEVNSLGAGPDWMQRRTRPAHAQLHPALPRGDHRRRLLLRASAPRSARRSPRRSPRSGRTSSCSSSTCCTSATGRRRCSAGRRCSWKAGTGRTSRRSRAGTWSSRRRSSSRR